MPALEHMNVSHAVQPHNGSLQNFQTSIHNGMTRLSLIGQGNAALSQEAAVNPA